jgi:hypothetical protein
MSRAKDFEYTQPVVTQYEYGIERHDLTAFLSIVYINGTFEKRFQGETAWSDAQRYALDIVMKKMVESW